MVLPLALARRVAAVAAAVARAAVRDAVRADFSSSGALSNDDDFDVADAAVDKIGKSSSSSSSKTTAGVFFFFCWLLLLLLLVVPVPLSSPCDWT